MAGYSQMNNGYNEQPGVNWGKVGLYTGGGVLATGAIRMGAIGAANSSAGQAMKRGMQSTGAAASKAGGWTKRQAQTGMALAKRHGSTGISMGKRAGRGLLGGRIGGSMNNRFEGFAKHGQASIDRMAGSIRNAQQAAWAKQGGNPFMPTAKDIPTASMGRTTLSTAQIDKQWSNLGPAGRVSRAKTGIETGMGAASLAAYRKRLGQIGDMPTAVPSTAWARRGAGKIGSAALGFFGAMDYRGQTLKRAGMIGARGMLGAGAIGLGAKAGMAALSLFNPFGD